MSSDLTPARTLATGIYAFFQVAAVCMVSIPVGCGSPEEGPGDEWRLICPDGTIKVGDDCLVPCPEGWGRGLDNRCRPPCLNDEVLVDGVCTRNCPEGTNKDGETGACIPEGVVDSPECSADIYNEEGVSGRRIYVNENGDDEIGDGSRPAPFATLRRAFEALLTLDDSRIAILVSSGSYNIEGTSLFSEMEDGEIAIIGLCAEKTQFTAAPSEFGLSLKTGGADLAVRGIDFQGGLFQLFILRSGNVVVEECRFSDWSGNTSITVVQTDGVLLKSSLFSFLGAAATDAVNITADRVQIESNRFEMFADSGISVMLLNPRTVHFTDNVISGSGSNGVSVHLDAAGESMVFSKSRFDGDWTDSGLAVVGHTDGATEMTLSRTVIENHRSKGEARSAAVSLSILDKVVIRDLMVEEGNVDAIFANNISDLSIEESVFRNVRWSGLLLESGTDFSNGCAISVRGSRFSNLSDYAIFHDNAYCDLSLQGNVIDDSRKGIYAAASALSAVDNDIGAVDGTAIHVQTAQAVEIIGNTVASIDDVGVELVDLDGEAGNRFLVEENSILDCQGGGLLLQNTGGGEVALTDNIVMGTRKKRYSDGAAPGGIAGDGVLVIASGEKDETRVKMFGNAIGQNARLGVLVHGSGSTVTVSDTSFETGNGYSGVIAGKEGEPCDLLTQDGAVVSGEDDALVEVVHDIYVPKSLSSGE